MYQLLPQSKFHLPNTESLPGMCTAHCTPKAVAMCPLQAVSLFWQIQVTYSQTALCSAILVTLNPSTASRPWTWRAPSGLEGIRGGSRSSCEWPPLRKHVILPADTMVKSAFVCFCELIHVCSVSITDGVHQGDILAWCSICTVIAVYCLLLVILSSLAVEFLLFSFICKLLLLAHGN